jgi:hypothetical protein
MGLFDGLFGGGKGAQVMQTNELQLSPEQQKLFDLAFPMATKAAKNPLKLPDGSSIAGFNADEIAGQDAARGAATGQVQNLVNQGAGTQQFLMDPALLSPDSNPFLRQQGQAVADDTIRGLTEQILPSLRQGSTVANGIFGSGGSREGIAQGLAVDRTTQNVSQSLADLYGGAYQNGLNTLGQAVNRNAQVAGTSLLPAEILSAVGGQQRGLEQAQLDESFNRQILEQQLPLLQAQDIFNLINGMPGQRGVSTVTGATPQTGGSGGSQIGGKLSGAIGGGLTGFSVGGPIGAGLGALAGLLAR